MNRNDMTWAEQQFRDGLAAAVQRRPDSAPIDMAVVRAASRRPARRSAWIGIAAVAVLVLGLSLWSVTALIRPVPQQIVAQPSETPAPPIDQTYWLLSSIAGSTPPPYAVPDLVFDGRGNVSSNSSCSPMHASYTRDGDLIRFRDIEIGGRCPLPSSAAAQQELVTARLAASRRLRVSNDELSLLDDAGAVLLTYAAHPPLGTPFDSASPAAVTKVAIRVRNDSGRPFGNVVVGWSTTGTTYGDLAPGQASEYRDPGGEAYAYAFVRVTVDGTPQTLQPTDYVGATPLRAGRYTYVLSLTDGELGLRLEQDR